MSIKQSRSEPTSPVQLLRIVAGEALVDIRTVERAFRGDRIKPLSRERIRLALEARGWTHLLPSADHGTR